MDHNITIPFLREIVVFLVATSVIIPIFHRLRVSPVLGYLIVGGLIGPFGLGLLAQEFSVLSYFVITDLEGMRTLGELGVVFLLFSIGLELSTTRLWTMRRSVFGLGSAQIVVSGVGIGAVVWLFGNSIEVSVLLGMCLALSSTAIVMQLLSQSHRVTTPVGRQAFSILLMQDLAVVPILFVVGMVGAGSGGNPALTILFAVGNAVLAVGIIYLVGRIVMRPFLRFAAMTPGRELFMAAVLLAIVGTAAMTGMAGLSMALGAFLAGLLLSETEFRHQVEIDMEPFKGLMMGLFFMSVGMGIDWRLLSVEPVSILAAVVGLYFFKSTVVALLSAAFGAKRHTALEAGLLLGQSGEFAFIVLAAALTIGLVSAEVSLITLLVVGLTMLITPLVAAGARRIAARLELRTASNEQGLQLADMGEVEGRVLVAGFGRVGRMVADVLVAETVPYLALDADADTVRIARRDNLPVYYGNAARLELLQLTRIEQARAVVVTMNAPQAAEQIVKEIREACPTVPVFARAADKAHATRLIKVGATMAVPETVEASLQLAGQVLRSLGAGDEVVRRRLEEQRTIESIER